MRRGGSRGGRGGLPSSTPIVSDRRHRDSDASICSSRPSSVATPHHHQQTTPSNSAMLRSVNSYLSSHNAPFSLKPPLPSARDTTDAVLFIFSRLGHSISSPQDRALEEELPPLLKFFGCPFKLTKSALKAPGTPHAWPSILTVLHFLVELACVHDHMNSSPAPFAQDNKLLGYALESYSLYISGEDDAVEALDNEYSRMAQQQVDSAAAEIDRMERELAEREVQVRETRNGPTPKEALERERDALLGDVAKFRAVVEAFSGKVAVMEEGIEGKKKELEAKEGENTRICEENEELRMRIAGQAVDVEGMERMRKELNLVERDIAEVKMSRKALEEKMEELDVAIGRKLKELIALEDQCNGAVRKLKLCNDFQYVLNVEGSSPTDVLGASYMSVLKPGLKVLAEDTKKGHVERIELMTTLQQRLQEQAAIGKEKKERAFALQAKIDDATSHSNSIKKEIEDHYSLCELEIKRMLTEIEARLQQLEIVEKEAMEFLKNTEMKLQEEIKMSDESIQMCAQELMALIDLISNYKEDLESTISGMKSDLCEIIKAVAEAHKASFSARLSTIGQPI